ncbi:hypothetical protein [Parathalassolituus penaei]|uniref:Uncharacterized protein n=1 Tax=Parathalassolituus penaei TaxID=2997323 RepID=A0A9X3EEQ7_9GAMM|nr:hypothetical protein [Parathalassolituus penaei]MCY0966179.1 hypothetical protein [Parathalassolituus penaei]
MSAAEFFITLLEGRLQAAVELIPDPENSNTTGNWLLRIRLMYDGAAAGVTSFTLHSHSAEEARDVARNIGSNPYLMREIDEFLWGESD